jgi:membrane-bound inhibitor of C-type lysozyme
MSLNRLLVVAVAGAMSLSACTREAETPAEAVDQTPPVAQPTAPAAPAIGYACESGQTVTVQYPDTATASVAYKGQTYALRLVPSASGARYSGSGVEWWIAVREGAENATLSRLGPNDDVGVAVLERCSRPSANPNLPVPGQPTAPQPAPGGVLPASTPCRAANLRLNSETGDAGMGGRTNVFGVTNAGTTPCSVAGYPAVSLLDAQGRALTAIRSDQNPNTATPVNIAAGGKAFFDIHWTVVPNEGAGERVCPSAARVRVLIPGDPAALAIPLAFQPCGGRIRVNPFRPGIEPGAAPAAVPAANAA